MLVFWLIKEVLKFIFLAICHRIYSGIMFIASYLEAAAFSVRCVCFPGIRCEREQVFLYVFSLVCILYF